MATYKVLQDIEAEDTLVGPLSLRQCIYAAIALIGGWLCFLCIKMGVAPAAIVFLPLVAFGAFFAIPWSKQQPTETWALAKVRYYLKPRKRIWNQTGTKQLVTITVPKNPKLNQVRHLSPYEVRHRLRALSDVIDSRGWATKNIDLGYYSQSAGQVSSDRLIDPASFPQDVPAIDPAAADDMFDTNNNPVAHKFDMMMAQSAGDHHQQLMQQMSQPPSVGPSVIGTSGVPDERPQPVRPGSGVLPPVDYRAIRAPGGVTMAQAFNPPAVQPAAVLQAADAVTAATDPAILELANNNDLNVATIAREAQARRAETANEVVVDLH